MCVYFVICIFAVWNGVDEFPIHYIIVSSVGFRLVEALRILNCVQLKTVCRTSQSANGIVTIPKQVKRWLRHV